MLQLPILNGSFASGPPRSLRDRANYWAHTYIKAQSNHEHLFMKVQHYCQCIVILNKGDEDEGKGEEEGAGR